jgi:hypothetical protein
MLRVILFAVIVGIVAGLVLSLVRRNKKGGGDY